MYLLAHDSGAWSDFSQVDVWGPGYVLVSSTVDQSSGTVYLDEIYRLYGNTSLPSANYLGIGTINFTGSSPDDAPLTDNNGNRADLKIVCVETYPQ